jgi:hypothetical protein
VIGDIVYQHDESGYQEVLLASDERGARLVLCLRYGAIALFRIEWAYDDGSVDNAARYDLLEAIACYRARVA